MLAHMPESELPARRDAWLHTPWFWMALLGIFWATGCALPFYPNLWPPIGTFLVVAGPLALLSVPMEKRGKVSFVLALLSFVVWYQAFFWIAIPYSIPISVMVIGFRLMGPLLILGLPPVFAGFMGILVLLFFVAIARAAPWLSTNKLLWALGFFLLVVAVTLPGCTDKGILPSF